MNTSAVPKVPLAVPPSHTHQPARTSATSAPALEARRNRLAASAWALLFVNVLGNPAGGLFHFPHVVGQLITQGCLVAAFLLALSANPSATVRPNIFLGLYSLLAVTSLMMSVRLVSLGTAYRGGRLALFIAVMWLLTPWWGRRDLLLLRTQLRLLALVMLSAVLSVAVAPHRALGTGFRLGDVIWPIPSTQLAHYAAELTGLTLLLWLGRLLDRRATFLIAAPSLTILFLSHTRTALVALFIAVALAGLSLFLTSKRTRMAFAALALVTVFVVLPLSPLIIRWMARGESPSQIATLTGRTVYWDMVFAEQRPETNKILGNGLSNGSIYNVGLPIDSSWVEDYQDQGLVGDILVAAMFLVLLAQACSRPRGPTRALALFLIIYCFIASFTEDGAGIASVYTLDLTLAAALLTPIYYSAYDDRYAPGAAALRAPAAPKRA